MSENTVTPVLMYTDRNAATNMEIGYNRSKEVLQTVVDAYYQIQSFDSNEPEAEPTTLPALTDKEFHLLFSDTEGLLFDKLTGGEGISIAGLKIDKKKAIEIIQKPQGYNGLLAAITNVLELSRDPYSDISVRYIGSADCIHNSFCLVDGQTVELSEKSLSIVASAGKRYATNPKKIAMYQFTKDVIELFKEYGLDQSFGNIGGADAINRVLTESIESANHFTGQWTPSPYLGSF